MQIQLTLEGEQIDSVIVETLKNHYYNIDRSTVPLFSHDENENLKEVNALREALKKVLDFYGEKV